MTDQDDRAVSRMLWKSILVTNSVTLVFQGYIPIAMGGHKYPYRLVLGRKAQLYPCVGIMDASIMYPRVLGRS